MVICLIHPEKVKDFLLVKGMYSFKYTFLGKKNLSWRSEVCIDCEVDHDVFIGK